MGLFYYYLVLLHRGGRSIIMSPPGELEKLESYEGQHVAYTLHGHHACCFSEEEEEVDSDGELLFDSETCALADQDPSKYQSS